MTFDFPHPPLVDAVVLLRPWERADIPERMMAFADPAVRRFSWPAVSDYTVNDAHRFFVEQQEGRARGAELHFALAEPTDPDAVLGGASLHAIDLEQGRAAIGYWVAPPEQRRGVATHATRLLARWAFETLGLARLELTCSPDNAASQRVAMRCGFVREGVLRSHMAFQGGRRDSVLFGLLPGELR